jgi:hypothetical protein
MNPIRSPDPVSRPRNCHRGKFVFGAVTIGILLIVAGVIPIFSSRAKIAVMSDNHSRMNEVGRALAMYAANNEGYLPAHLEDLFPSYISIVSTLKSPLLMRLEEGRDPIPWSYFPGHRAYEQPTAVIVTFPIAYKGYRGLLFSDFAYKVVTDDEFKQLVK